MKNPISRFSFFALLGSFVVLGSLFAFKPTVKDSTGIQWVSFDNALQMNEKKKRKIFIDVYTDWCGWCKVMDKKTFSNAKIADYVGKKYYAVKLNAESNATVTYKGKKMTEAELAQKVFGVTSFPTTLYLDENTEMLTPVAGYLEVPMLDKILKYYGEEIYKTKGWEDYSNGK